MTNYDYISGKKRIKDILNNKLEIIKKDEVPSEKNFTFDNGYYSWVTALFVDIRDSSNLFSNGDKEIVSKIIRSFTSEIIEILRDSDKFREIGIRGDCVYAIYTSPSQTDDQDIVNKAYYINTFMKMINKLLKNKDYTTIKVGIGIATAKELVVKAGRKDVGINNLVWIGDAVTKASNLSSLGNKKSIKTITLCPKIYKNIIDSEIKNSGEQAKTWFTKESHSDYGEYYHCSVTMSPFNKWVEDGMKE